jgi:hypothetical protein
MGGGGGVGNTETMPYSQRKVFPLFESDIESAPNRFIGGPNSSSPLKLRKTLNKTSLARKMQTSLIDSGGGVH